MICPKSPDLQGAKTSAGCAAGGAVGSLITLTGRGVSTAGFAQGIVALTTIGMTQPQRHKQKQADRLWPYDPGYAILGIVIP
jgi:hypothetical protein